MRWNVSAGAADGDACMPKAASRLPEANGLEPPECMTSVLNRDLAGETGGDALLAEPMVCERRRLACVIASSFLAGLGGLALPGLPSCLAGR